MTKYARNNRVCDPTLPVTISITARASIMSLSCSPPGLKTPMDQTNRIMHLVSSQTVHYTFDNLARIHYIALAVGACYRLRQHPGSDE